MRRVWFSSLLICALVIATTVARAQEESDEYRRWIETAVEEYGEGHYEEARALFARAHAEQPTARTHRGLGMVAFELRDYVDCINHLEAALQSPVKRLDGRLRTATEDLLARANEYVGRVTIETKPSEALLMIDRKPTDHSSPIVLRVGSHDLELSADGYETDKRSLSVIGGESERIKIVLRQQLANAVAPEAQPTRDDRRAWYKSPWLWTAVGVVAVGGVATALVVTRKEEHAANYGGTVGEVLMGP